MIQPCLLLFFWVSFVVWSGCRKPFVRLVKFRACLLCFRVLFWAFCFSGRSIPDALFFPFTYCIRATFLLLKESACIGITNFPLLVSCSCTRTMHAVATPVFTSLSLSSSFPCMREEEDQALTMESFFRMEDQRTS